MQGICSKVETSKFAKCIFSGSLNNLTTKLSDIFERRYILFKESNICADHAVISFGSF
jgi:hypothetical protein